MISNTTETKCYDLTGLSSQILNDSIDKSELGNGTKFTALDTGQVWYLDASNPNNPRWLEFIES